MSSSRAETAVSYASLILADADIAITAEKLQIILEAAGIDDIEPIWTALFAKALEAKDVKAILTTIASSENVRGPNVEKSQDDREGEEGSKDDEEQGIEDEPSDDDIGLSLFD
ncbi:60s acidic ribosomal protein [Aaosphaeria arxii CBS 175.79]|uniref:Large ribosomal subunit protein P1 n=1 Tax=Aaosphaeria arxii CBS 175.79 TaxID=1450172 RepID=A0A6A5Y514_9PLEO|nr:60s acidic ribosomal protein [Aaosphaeria arxii CBS 175.79]KAF2020652.1 60s acidic ribosomal protein [Aaosphaeria arxii CBS 175.79]